jgi:hypothetical protein
MSLRWPILFSLTVLSPLLGRAEELPVLRRSFAEPRDPRPPAFVDGVFDPRPGETIALIGGTDVHEMDRHGYLETVIHRAWPDQSLKLRNLAWQGDTVYHQARPQFFYTAKGDPQPGSILDHRRRTEAGIIVFGFGKLESLDGAQDVPRFLAAYAAVLDLLMPLTPRVVLVAPPAFFPTGPAKALTADRNATLARYVAGIRDLAAARGCLYVDLFHPTLETGDPAWSSNGVHLSAAGHKAVAELLAEKLNFPSRDAAPADDDPGLSQSLRQAIERKNRLWWQYYQPTNWAFLFGDRQHVPASRDPVDRDERWFVREIDSLPGLIAEAEADIHRYAAGLKGKKP